MKRLTKWVGGTTAALVLGISGAALAQEQDDKEGTDASRVGERLGFNEAATPVGVDVRAGLEGFTGDLAGRTRVGPSLGITADAQPFSLVGVEVGYEGARLPIDDGRVPDGEAIWRHALTGLAKVGPLIQDRYRPYVGAGFGVGYHNASEGAEDVYDNDFTTEVPVAAGLDYELGSNFSAGVRGTYRWLMGENITDSADQVGNAEGGVLSGMLTLGGRF